MTDIVFSNPKFFLLQADSCFFAPYGIDYSSSIKANAYHTFSGSQLNRDSGKVSFASRIIV